MAQGVKTNDDTLFCTPCSFRENKLSADFWCFDCKEGLCASCKAHHESSKLLSAHDTTKATERHTMPFLPNVPYTCIKHSKNFDFYCYDHQVPCCIQCIPGDHQRCTKLITMEEAIVNVKSSDDYKSIQDNLTFLLRKLKALKQGEENGISSLPNQRKEVIADVEEFKEKAIESIRKCASDLVNEVDQHINQYKVNSKEVLEKLQEQIGKVNKTIKQFVLVQENASNLQIFLTKKYFKSLVLEELEILDRLENSGIMYDITLKFNKNEKMMSSAYGTISATMSKLNINPIGTTQGVSRYDTQRFLIKDIDNIKLMDVIQIKFPANCQVTNCVILENGGMVFTDFSSNSRLLCYSGKGKLLRTIPTDSPPFDVAVLSESKVVVSLTADKKLAILELVTDHIINVISLENQCYRVCVNENYIIVSMRDSGISILDRSGSVVRTLKLPCVTMCCTSGYIYYIQEKSNVLKCCNFFGLEIWQKKLNLYISNMDRFYSITSDMQGNIFVGDFRNGIVCLISKEGNKSRELLKRADGIYNTYDTGGLCLDESKNLFLVCAKWTEYAKLFQIS